MWLCSILRFSITEDTPTPSQNNNMGSSCNFEQLSFSQILLAFIHPNFFPAQFFFYLSTRRSIRPFWVIFRCWSKSFCHQACQTKAPPPTHPIDSQPWVQHSATQYHQAFSTMNFHVSENILQKCADKNIAKTVPKVKLQKMHAEWLLLRKNQNMTFPQLLQTISSFRWIFQNFAKMTGSEHFRSSTPIVSSCYFAAFGKKVRSSTGADLWSVAPPPPANQQSTWPL